MAIMGTFGASLSRLIAHSNEKLHILRVYHGRNVVPACCAAWNPRVRNLRPRTPSQEPQVRNHAVKLGGYPLRAETVGWLGIQNRNGASAFLLMPILGPTTISGWATRSRNPRRALKILTPFRPKSTPRAAPKFPGPCASRYNGSRPRRSNARGIPWMTSPPRNKHP